jgi:hypothetical protein
MDSRVHDLKVWREPFLALIGGEKTCEVRKNDRDFAAGDVLRLREYDPVEHVYTGRETARRVTHVLPGGQFGIAEGFTVLSLALLAQPKAA